MQYITTPNRIYLEHEGEELAEITFPEREPRVFVIDHTFVDDRLRGQGIASELVRRAVEDIKAQGGTVRATCSYAIAWLQRHQDSLPCGQEATK